MRAAELIDPVGRAGAQLARAVLDDAAAAGLAPLLLDARSHAWASITFTGGRHALRLLLPDAAAARSWAAALPEHEFRLPRLLVADLAVRWRDTELEVEALILESD